MDLQPVISSSIAAIGYDAGTSQLTVQFSKSQRVYTYYGVPESEYKALVEAPSIGRHFVQHVKNVYEF